MCIYLRIQKVNNSDEAPSHCHACSFSSPPMITYSIHYSALCFLFSLLCFWVLFPCTKFLWESDMIQFSWLKGHLGYHMESRCSVSFICPSIHPPPVTCPSIHMGHLIYENIYIFLFSHLLRFY